MKTCKPPPALRHGGENRPVVRLGPIEARVRSGWRRGLVTLDTFKGDLVQAVLLIGSSHGFPRYVLARLATTVLATEGRHRDLRLVGELVDRFWSGRDGRESWRANADTAVHRLPGVDGVVRQGWRKGLECLATYDGDPVPAAMLATCGRDVPPTAQAQIATVLLAAEGRQADLRAVADLVDQFWTEEP